MTLMGSRGHRGLAEAGRSRQYDAKAEEVGARLPPRYCVESLPAGLGKSLIVKRYVGTALSTPHGRRAGRHYRRGAQQ